MSRHPELRAEIIDVGELIRSIVRVSEPKVDNAKLMLGLHLPSGLPLLSADRHQVRQVLSNLIENAIKFTPADGHIEIAVEFDPARGLQLSVIDAGIGIAQEDLPRVLECFPQIGSSPGHRRAEAGVGLPTAKAIMELHGGTLEIASALGIGTKATAVFPPSRIIRRENVTVPNRSAA